MSTEPVKYQIRRRLNVSTSVKGVRTTDTTLEIVSDEQAGWKLDNLQFLEIQTAFQAEVDKLYPPPLS
jgi:hypothetical protein